jgi:tetratricopeptide (TPR) repeat protein
MKHLDLVIAVDTSVAHLAGALGVPVWVALPTASDWRWLQKREDTPWYPSMRLFRQKKRGDWGEVFKRMALALEAQPALESPARYAERGLAALKEGKFAEAATLLTRAIELDPKNAILHNNRAVAWDRDGKKAEALADAPRPGDLRRHVGRPCRRRARPTVLAGIELRIRLALVAAPRRQPVVSARAAVSADTVGRLGGRIRADGCGAAAEKPPGLNADHGAAFAE